MSIATIRVGRRNEPILGYVPKNYEKKRIQTVNGSKKLFTVSLKLDGNKLNGVLCLNILYIERTGEKHLSGTQKNLLKTKRKNSLYFLTTQRMKANKW